MILSSEVEACLQGRLRPEDEDVAVDHYALGGFHSRVLEADRKAFKTWLNKRPARSLLLPSGEIQLELIPLTTGAA